MEWLTSNLGMAVSGGVITIIIAIAAKYLRPKKMRAIGYKLGLATTTLGSSKLGLKGWNKIENFLQKCGLAFLEGYQEGLDSDDQ